MLPSNLLRTRKKQGRIAPEFAALNEENLEAARRAISIAHSHVGGPVGDLEQAFSNLEEEADGDYRFIRGLCTLLERRITTETQAHVDPPVARRIVFEVSAGLGPVTTPERRAEVLQEAANSLGATSREVEDSLWADYDENQVIAGFDAPAPEDLLRQYNLSLAQTLVFKAAVLEFTTRDNYQRIFRLIKYLGLMYHVEKDDDYRVRVSGPVSLFKLTDKYGTALARLLPLIMASGGWQLEASIIQDKKKARVYEMQLSSQEHQDLFPERAVEPEYDSMVEEKFARAFQSLDLEWNLHREPAPLVAGRYVTIPDFSFERAGETLYMEIVGFWTEEYLQRKVEKLQRVEEPVLVVADEQLACSPHIRGMDDVVFYKREVPLQPVIARLRELDEKRVKQEVQELSPEEIQLGEPIVGLDDLAEEHGVSVEALRDIAPKIDDYRLIGSQLISEDKLGEIGNTDFEGLSYGDATRLLREQGVCSVPEALDALGYKVKWTGLSEEDGVVTRR